MSCSGGCGLCIHMLMIGRRSVSSRCWPHSRRRLSRPRGYCTHRARAWRRYDSSWVRLRVFCAPIAIVISKALTRFPRILGSPFCESGMMIFIDVFISLRLPRFHIISIRRSKIRIPFRECSLRSYGRRGWYRLCRTIA